MNPTTDRPEACAVDGKVHVFVGGYHQVMSIASAKSLISKTNAAIEQAKQQESVKV